MSELEAESLQRLAMTEDELFVLIGRDVTGPQALPLKPSELAERGRRWFIAQRNYLEQEICSRDAIRQFAVANSENASIAVELAKLLAGLLLPVNPTTLAVLLAKKGLKSFCAMHWVEK